MTPYTQSVEQSELAEIEQKLNSAPHIHVRMDVDDPFLTGNHQLLTSDRRRAEICYVMHRGDPQQGVLLHIKRFYPENAYRLPTGGIHQGERVLETLGREIEEETGLTVGDAPHQVQVQRFLGVVSYALYQMSEAKLHEFATYHFLVQMPAQAELNPQDEDEQIGGWKWLSPDALNATADLLEKIGDVAPDWADWGRFRAVSHRAVAEALGWM
jgi:NAD+ diphosphatase